MKRIRIGLLAVGAAVALAAPAGAATHGVTVGQGGDRFTPADITITQGDTVTWTWADGGHNVKSRSGPEAFDSGFKNSGATWSRQFTAPGTYTYVCTDHGGMNGSVVVNAAPAPEPAPTQPAPPPPATTSPIAGSSSTGQAPVAPAGPSPESATLVAHGVPVVTGLRATMRRTTARLRVKLTEASTIVVALRRLGAGRKAIRQRWFAGKAGVNALRLSLRGLPRGRYRVRVVAFDGEANRSPARVVTVRRR